MSGGMSDFMQVLQSVAPAGSRVRKGDIVAQFDTQYQEQRLDDYRATVEQTDRSMRSIDIQIDVARKYYDQNIKQSRGNVEKAKLDLKTTPVRSSIDAELLKLSLEEAQADLKQYEWQIPYQEISMKSQRRNAEIDLEQSKLELKRAEANVQKMSIRAPMDGMLVMENTRRGTEFAQIQAGDQIFPGQMFARIIDPSSMLVAATVNQADVEGLRVNAKAILHFDAYPGLELPAHVTAIGAITSAGGMRANYFKEIPVFLKIDQMDPRVIPDLSVSADIILDSVPSATLAPLESIFQDQQNAKPYVYVRTAAGFEKREVELGLTNNIKAAVVSGLKPGEVVALDRPPQPGERPTRSAQARPAPFRCPDARLRRDSFSGVLHV
jgi:multidrug efflux pump subunit AcrA (membrane-fusion protein)